MLIQRCVHGFDLAEVEHCCFAGRQLGELTCRSLEVSSGDAQGFRLVLHRSRIAGGGLHFAGCNRTGLFDDRLRPRLGLGCQPCRSDGGVAVAHQCLGAKILGIACGGFDHRIRLFDSCELLLGGRPLGIGDDGFGILVCLRQDLIAALSDLVVEPVGELGHRCSIRLRRCDEVCSGRPCRLEDLIGFPACGIRDRVSLGVGGLDDLFPGRLCGEKCAADGIGRCISFSQTFLERGGFRFVGAE